MWSIWDTLKRYFGTDKPAPVAEPWTGPVCRICGKPILDYKHKNKSVCNNKECQNAARREKRNENR
jgi:hypothetical protein